VTPSPKLKPEALKSPKLNKSKIANCTEYFKEGEIIITSGLVSGKSSGYQ
jgi:hypothetical protein